MEPAMNQIASNVPSTAADPASGPIFLPPADIVEKGDSVVMLLDLPGADPASLDVTLEKRILTIAAHIPAADPEGYTPQHMEFGSGTYERRFVFSEQMDGERIDAVLKDGVLRLTVPKAADSGAKKITVKAQ
jgi:HSP20 family molecular chaperone IbpA